MGNRCTCEFLNLRKMDKRSVNASYRGTATKTNRPTVQRHGTGLGTQDRRPTGENRGTNLGTNRPTREQERASDGEAKAPKPQNLSTTYTTTTVERHTIHDKHYSSKDSSTLWAKIIMGFAVLILVGVLIRLIQLRAKRLRALGGVQEGQGAVVASEGGGCCYLPVTLAIMLGGLVMVYIMYASSVAKEEQKKANMSWNYTLSFLFLLAVIFLMHYSRLMHSPQDIPGSGGGRSAGPGVWIYFTVAAAAVAAAKITNRLLRSPDEIHHHRSPSEKAEAKSDTNLMMGPAPAAQTHYPTTPEPAYASAPPVSKAPSQKSQKSSVKGSSGNKKSVNKSQKSARKVGST